MIYHTERATNQQQENLETFSLRQTFQFLSQISIHESQMRGQGGGEGRYLNRRDTLGGSLGLMLIS